MKPYLTLLLVPLIAISCSKSDSGDCDGKWKKVMATRWAKVSSCSPEFKHYLGKGTYQSETIYYTSISCIACDMAPPAYGVNCAGDSIRIANWNDVKEISMIATCRDL